MSTILTFPSNLAPVIPTFVANGSKIEKPDLQVVFWGPYWPGTGQLTVGSLMQAVTTLVTGTFLEGMKQYGYTGPVNLRQPIVNTGNPNFTLPPPAKNLDQSTTTFSAIRSLVDAMMQNNAMGDVSSNHDLLVLVFLDPSFVYPQTYDAAGNSTGYVYGAHGPYIVNRALQPAIRFSMGWVGTQPASGLSAFDRATATFGHELVESISNPFGGSGWVQTSPASGPSAGEIGDICNNTVCVADSIAVEPYWGVQQKACILSTETRSLTLSQPIIKHLPHDGPTQYAVVELGPLCGKGTFDFVERTWDNVVAVTAVHPGYQVPVLKWWINDTPVAGGSSTILAPCTWKTPTSPNLGAIKDTPDGSVLKVPLAAAASEHGVVVGHPGTPISQLPGNPVLTSVGTTPGHPVLGGGGPMHNPFGDTTPHLTVATLRLAVIGSVLTIECGPGQGNVSLNVKCRAVENWDSIAGTTVTTQITTSAVVTMDNQDIVWGTHYQQAVTDCWKKTHKGQAGGIPGIPLNPVDPGPEGTVTEIGQQAGQINKL